MQDNVFIDNATTALLFIFIRSDKHILQESKCLQNENIGVGDEIAFQADTRLHGEFLNVYLQNLVKYRDLMNMYRNVCRAG